MKKIQLTRGQVALVDDEDFEYLNQWLWTAQPNGSNYYALRYKHIWMHRVIMKTPKGMYTDHINHNGLDNRKANLRICSRSQNLRNQKLSKNNTSGYKGVHWKKNQRKWLSKISLNGTQLVLGLFTAKKEAAKVYNEAAKKYYGAFAYQNKIEE